MLQRRHVVENSLYHGWTGWYDCGSVPVVRHVPAFLTTRMFLLSQGHISVWDALTGRRVKTVLLGDGDTTVFVRCVNVCDNKTVVCDYGKEVKIVTFPAVMDKAE